MFATHNNPCPLPEELLPEDLSVDSKSTNAPLQRPDKFLESENSRRFQFVFHGKSMKKQSSTKQGPYRASAQQRHGLQQTGRSCSSLGKTRKGAFSRIKKTLQLYHWLKCGIGMIICIYWLEEWKNDWEIQTFSNLPNVWCFNALPPGVQHLSLLQMLPSVVIELLLANCQLGEHPLR